MSVTRFCQVLTLAFLVVAAPSCGPVGEDQGAAFEATILVSMDGFRWDYPELAETPNVDRLMARGVRAASMIPVFPSKTFPSHYSIVTGLYPGHHGIISNNMRDPGWPEPFGLGARDEVQNSRWWGGEPIWVTANRSGIRTGVYFWPGSEAPVQGVMPDAWFPYDEDVPWSTRIDTVLGWLDEPVEERKGFIALYLEEPNTAGHRHGPEAPETIAAITAADAALGELLDGIEARGLTASTNVVLVSDHGMALNSEDRVIVLDDLVELAPDELFEAGAFLQIFPAEGREQQIYDALAGAHPHLRVFRPSEAPPELHLYEHPRLAPILGTPDPAWEVLPRSALEWRGVVPGDHGQDPSHPDMQGIFIAAGPDFASGLRVDSIEGVDIYNLLAAALGVEAARNDGSLERTAGILAGQR